MPPNDGDKLNRIEELKSKLFSKNYQTKIEHRDRFTQLDRKDIPDTWENSKRMMTDAKNSASKFFMKSSAFKKFFIFSLCFFGLTLLYAAYVFLGGSNTVSNDKIDIAISGNNFAAGGEDLSLVVGITNRNNTALDLVDLIVEYPKSSSADSPDLTTGTERMRVSIGTIPAGAVHNENLKLVLFGEQGSVRPIKISIEYRVPGSNAIFVKDKSYQVTINSTPLNLAIDAPVTISSNQAITLNVKASLNATKAASDIVLKMDYPPGFQFVSSIPEPSIGNNVWDLGDLAPGAEHDIAIQGKMIDVFDGEEKTFRLTGGTQSTTDKSLVGVLLNSTSHTLTVSKPFIEANLSINGISRSEYTSDGRSPIEGQILWSNNSESKVDDLIIQAKISGNAVDRKSINGQQGFYDSSHDTITWDKNSVNNFSEISPGDSGTVNFSLSPSALTSGGGSIKIEVSISGKQLTEGYATNDLSGTDSATIKIISDVGFFAKALYYSGAFTNKGAIPPKVEKETTYSIVWSLADSANNLSKAAIKATLPSWISFVGTVSPKGENLTYNATTKEVSWNIGNITKGTGATGTPRSVTFQVSLTPSLSQLGTSPILINNAVLTGHDDFANVDVKVSRPALTTSLQSDPSFPSGGGAVVE